MAKATHIRRNLALKEMDVRFLTASKRYVFSVKFVLKDGRVVYFPHACTTGAGKMNNRRWRLKGIQPCNAQGEPIDHIYPVSINAILMYNNMQIIL